MHEFASHSIRINGENLKMPAIQGVKASAQDDTRDPYRELRLFGEERLEKRRTRTSFSSGSDK